MSALLKSREFILALVLAVAVAAIGAYDSVFVQWQNISDMLTETSVLFMMALAQMVACDIHPLNNLRVLQYFEHTWNVPQAEREDWVKHWIVEGFTAVDNATYPLPPGETSVYQGKNPFADMCAEKAITLIGKFLRRAVRDGNDLEARDGMALAATLGGLAFCFAIGVGIPIGFYSAVKRGQWQDYSGSLAALLMVCVPGLVIGPSLVTRV